MFCCSTLALSTTELKAVWPAWSQNNGLGWDITAYPWGVVFQWASTIKTGRRSGEGDQAYSQLSTTHGHITDCKLDSVVYA